MLSRRGFAGFASCALCAITGFVATDASAQGTPPPPAATPGVKRKILSQMDGPASGYVTITVEAEIDANATVARHTHPGIEAAYILDGEIDLAIEGQGAKVYKAGDSFQVAPGTPHGGKAGGKPLKITSTYVVEKGKPLASPV